MHEKLIYSLVIMAINQQIFADGTESAPAAVVNTNDTYISAMPTFKTHGFHQPVLEVRKISVKASL